jgi:rhodanese-related sulfurtransferase
MPPAVPAISVDELQLRLQSEPPPFLLDVREPWEYGRGHIAGAHLIPLGELEERVGEVPKDRPVLAVCHVGQRSLLAATFLRRQGYSQVTNVDGGIAAWVERGFPLSR